MLGRYGAVVWPSPISGSQTAPKSGLRSFPDASTARYQSYQSHQWQARLVPLAPLFPPIGKALCRGDDHGASAASGSRLHSFMLWIFGSARPASQDSWDSWLRHSMPSETSLSQNEPPSDCLQLWGNLSHADLLVKDARDRMPLLMSCSLQFVILVTKAARNNVENTPSASPAPRAVEDLL